IAVVFHKPGRQTAGAGAWPVRETAICGHESGKILTDYQVFRFVAAPDRNADVRKRRAPSATPPDQR
ncbi:MAG: hypothetical protein KDH19_11470, partial [Geminicoccaceae bacterium]|nr:hypothetical protein [Geminicoccaceae bacterium]